jgi:hypothetical protein
MAFGFAEQVARDDCDVMYGVQAQCKGQFLSLELSLVYYALNYFKQWYNDRQRVETLTDFNSARRVSHGMG